MEWVCGFLFNKHPGWDSVALITKRRGPGMLIGKLNGIGGKIEPGETPIDAMRREFQEETGLVIEEWYKFCDLAVINYGTVHMYYARNDTPNVHRGLRSVTDEKVEWFPVKLLQLDSVNVYSNLRWLIPMALADAPTYASVTEARP